MFIEGKEGEILTEAGPQPPHRFSGPKNRKERSRRKERAGAMGNTGWSIEGKGTGMQ